MSRLLVLRLLAGAAVVLAATVAGPPAGASRGAAPTAPAQQTRRDLPSKEQWLADVHQAMVGARAYLKKRAATSDEKLGVNLDIDNTVLATQFGGGPIPQMLKFAAFAQRHHVAVLFNTGRYEFIRSKTMTLLTSAGFHPDELCMHHHGQSLLESKQACREHYASEGYVLIENIGNNDTDLEGGGYEKGFKLPDYDGQLG